MDAEPHPSRQAPFLWFLLLLTWLGTLLCLVLLREQAGGMCGAGSGCERVLASRYAVVAGVPLALAGLVYYGGMLLLVLLLLATGWSILIPLLLGGATMAAAVSLILVVLQATVINAFCVLCLSSAVICLTILVVAWLLRGREFPPRAPAAAAALGVAWAVSAAAAAPPTIFKQEPPVARVDGHEISRSDLDRTMQLTRQEAERQLHAVEQERLEELIDRHLLEKEARRRKLDVLKLPNPKALMSSLRQEARIERLLRPPLPRKMELNSQLGHRLGRADAPAKLTVFSDFACPFCRKLAPVLHDLQQSFPDQVALIFRHFPLDEHPRARPAAAAAECAGKQGKFWAYHDWLFQQGRTLSDHEFLAGARAVDLDEEAFLKCYSSGAGLAAVGDSEREGAKAGIFGTPMVFLNGRQLPQLDRHSMEGAIREELRHGGNPSAP